MTFRVTHRTTYRYQDPVSSSYGQIHLLPRDRPGQVCHGTDVAIEPEPGDYRERTDFFGNRVAYFDILTSHRSLTITTTSSVSVARRAIQPPLPAGQRWEAARLAENGGDDNYEALDARQFVLDSPLASCSAQLAGYARPSFAPSRPILEALVELTERIHDDFAFKPGATSVSTSAEEVLTKRKGVCQDFAHVAVGCLRSLGLAARYVSGYLETHPPAGKPRLQGADVSHAWASVFVPGAGWLDLDPTNRTLVDDRYITTAWGRDYRDVPPFKGVMFTEGTTHDLEVAVDVLRLDEG